MWHRIFVGVAVAIAIAFGMGVGRGIVDQVAARVLSGPERQRAIEWQQCYGPDAAIANAGCSARGTDEHERPEHRAAAYMQRARAQPEDAAARISDYSLAAALDPNNAYAYAYRAEARLTVGDVEEAAVDLQRAMTLKPGDFHIRYFEGILWFERGEYQRAAARFQDLLDDLDIAETRREEAVRRAGFEPSTEDPTSFDSDTWIVKLNMLRATSLYSVGEAALAAQLRDRALALDPHAGAEMEVLCGNRLRTSVNLDAVLAACDAAIAFFPVEMSHRVNRGVAALRDGNARRALADFENILGSAPNVEGAALTIEAAMARYNVALALYGRGLARRQLNLSGGDQDLIAATSLSADAPGFYQHFRLRPS